ncbi:hypothetical protein QTN25_009521 [Entamoeba marina]
MSLPWSPNVNRFKTPPPHSSYTPTTIPENSHTPPARYNKRNRRIQHYNPSNDTAKLGEVIFSEHPSRTIFITNLPPTATQPDFNSLLSTFGELQGIYFALPKYLMATYYDIRVSKVALKHLQTVELFGKTLDVHYTIPIPSEHNSNSTLVVFNIDINASPEEFRSLFSAFGDIKEIRETPNRGHHKFVEFYDLRCAHAALLALNKTYFHNRILKIEESRPGGIRQRILRTQGLDVPKGLPAFPPPAFIELLSDDVQAVQQWKEIISDQLNMISKEVDHDDYDEKDESPRRDFKQFKSSGNSLNSHEEYKKPGSGRNSLNSHEEHRRPGSGRNSLTSQDEHRKSGSGSGRNSLTSQDEHRKLAPGSGRNSLTSQDEHRKSGSSKYAEIKRKHAKKISNIPSDVLDAPYTGPASISNSVVGSVPDEPLDALKSLTTDFAAEKRVIVIKDFPMYYTTKEALMCIEKVLKGDYEGLCVFTKLFKTPVVTVYIENDKKCQMALLKLKGSSETCELAFDIRNELVSPLRDVQSQAFS